MIEQQLTSKAMNEYTKQQSSQKSFFLKIETRNLKLRWRKSAGTAAILYANINYTSLHKWMITVVSNMQVGCASRFLVFKLCIPGTKWRDSLNFWQRRSRTMSYQKNHWTANDQIPNFGLLRQRKQIMIPRIQGSKQSNWLKETWAWNEQQGKWKESLFFKDETVFSFMV